MVDTYETDTAHRRGRAHVADNGRFTTDEATGRAMVDALAGIELALERQNELLAELLEDD